MRAGDASHRLLFLADRYRGGEMASTNTPNGWSYDVVLHDVPMRPWTILAQDPSILGAGGKALTTTVMLPAERLERGPKGFRVHVIDYDASTNTFYGPRRTGVDSDVYANVTDIDKLVGDPHFHQQNVYAIVMATLQSFEGALGRRVPWGFNSGHQIKVAPHAFLDANAFYSRDAESLNFGYFPNGKGRMVFTCLSHDIVVHETTHALLDGLRPFYLLPSSTDQAGFHEGFSDIIALLSVFNSQEIIDRLLLGLTGRGGRIPLAKLTATALGGAPFAKLAKEMGAVLHGVPTAALRESLDIKPDKRLYESDRFQEEHDRGELLVAIALRAFFSVWERRLKPLKEGSPDGVARTIVAEEGVTAAGHLQRMMIRALDYMPPVDMTYRDFLSALLTADMQMYPDDKKYEYRKTLRASFEAYGVTPANAHRPDGAWDPPLPGRFTHAGIHFDLMRRSPQEVFRFVWENKAALRIEPNAFTRVTSVRPVMRISNDRTALCETVVEYVQEVSIFAGELAAFGIARPHGMPASHRVTLYGGGTLIFNEFGLLKFHIGTGVASARQTERLESLWQRGYFTKRRDSSMQIANLHRDRVLRPTREIYEEW